MEEIRAMTLLVPDPSEAAKALARVFDWEVEADFGSFTSVLQGDGIPIWMNVPYGEPATSGLVLHIATEDVDRSFARAVCGAESRRDPQDMDYGERSAYVVLEELPGITFDFSRPLGG
jgi:hypothetical protein